MAVTDLRAAARDHLWLHFTRMHGYQPPVIVRGEGCYLCDDQGKRYLDALAGLFSVNIGYSYGEEIGQAALEQMRELPFYTNWSYAHPRAIELAQELARARAAAHQPRVLRLRRLRGGRVGVEDGAPVPHGARRAPLEGVSRRTAYHGTTMGALSINGIPALRAPFEPLVPDVVARAQHEPLPPPADRDRGRVHAVPARRPRRRDRAGRARDGGDGDLRAGAERRRVVHAAGRLLRRACARSATATASSSAPTR